MTGVHTATLRRFAALAGERLVGDWVIVGGAVLPLLGIGHRVTQDIDVAGPEASTQADVVALMEIAVELGLPPEAVNAAGAFFLRSLDGWRDDLVVVHTGTSARILRPSATLYLLMKIERLTASDLGDCREMLRFAAATAECVDGARLRGALEDALADGPHAAREERLQTLRDLLP